MQAWNQQMDQMCEAGVMSKGQLRRIRNQENMNGGTLKDCSWLRDRLGIKTAFLEDPILRGLLAARGSKGLATRIKAAVTKEEVEKARAKRDKGEALIAIRQLIGPRGGLPTLRGDLIKLATLLHLEVPEKITIDQLKEKIRPVLKTIVDSAPKGSFGSDGNPEPKTKSSPKPSPKREATSSIQPNPNTLQEMEAMLRRQDQRTQEVVLTSMRQIVEELNYRQTLPPVASMNAVYHDLAFGDNQLPMEQDFWDTAEPAFDFGDTVRAHGWTPEEVAGAMEEEPS